MSRMSEISLAVSYDGEVRGQLERSSREQSWGACSNRDTGQRTAATPGGLQQAGLPSWRSPGLQEGAFGGAVWHSLGVETETREAHEEECQADDGKEKLDPVLKGEDLGLEFVRSKARTSAETTGRWPRRIQLAAVERGTPRSWNSIGSRSSQTRSRSRWS
jgi:hypothetical protein